MIAEITQLVKREIASEWKQKYAFGGVLLYVVSTVFVCKLSFSGITEPLTWSALFWVIILFTSVNAVAKSFLQESSGRLLYFYTLASPQAVILSKMIYNLVLSLVLCFICFSLYVLFLGNPVANQLLFIITAALGCCGFSCVLTLVSAIAAKTNNNFTLMAILSFPILLPLIMTLIKLSKYAIENISMSVCYGYLLILVMINLVVCILAYLLFPYLWRD